MIIKSRQIYADRIVKLRHTVKIAVYIVSLHKQEVQTKIEEKVLLAMVSGESN